MQHRVRQARIRRALEPSRHQPALPILLLFFLAGAWVTVPMALACSDYQHVWHPVSEQTTATVGEPTVRLLLASLGIRLGSGRWGVGIREQAGDPGQTASAALDPTVLAAALAAANVIATIDHPGDDTAPDPAHPATSRLPRAGSHDRDPVPRATRAAGPTATSWIACPQIPMFAWASGSDWLPAGLDGMVWLDPVQARSDEFFWIDHGGAPFSMWRCGQMEALTTRVMAVGRDGGIRLIEEIPVRQVLAWDGMLIGTGPMAGIWFRRILRLRPPVERQREWLLSPPPAPSETLYTIPPDQERYYWGATVPVTAPWAGPTAVPGTPGPAVPPTAPTPAH